MTEGEIDRGECGDCLKSSINLTRLCLRCENPESHKYRQAVQLHDSCEHYDGVFSTPEKERNGDATQMPMW